MYTKLMKYETKNIARLLLPFYIAILVLSILTKWINSIDYITDNVPLFGNILTIIYYISLVVLIVLTILFMIIRFYHNLLTGEGYLMFTLPVSTKQLILSKFFVALSYTLFSICGVLVSLRIVNEQAFTFESDVYGIKTNSLKLFIDKIGTLNFIYLLLLFLAVIAFQLLLFYLCIALGQMLTGNKILGAVLSYIVIYSALQMCALVCVLICSVLIKNPTELLNHMDILLPLGIILFGILSYIFYRVTLYLLNNKLNLE